MAELFLAWTAINTLSSCKIILSKVQMINQEKRMDSIVQLKLMNYEVIFDTVILFISIIS